METAFTYSGAEEPRRGTLLYVQKLDDLIIDTGACGKENIKGSRTKWVESWYNPSKSATSLYGNVVRKIASPEPSSSWLGMKELRIFCRQGQIRFPFPSFLYL